ncbi:MULTISPECIES: HD domain-containing phosphohydrolase [unclassified Acidovorax]|jgi:HD-GYP domain-containing protein (c-di-GMP phosphodiesterase class II)|uniref:HD-GYP domain-containing protein n=1 Tax=unclassified Acidovorax TaxID=2684926 RepID=UPI000BDBE81C|nr:MULTISPECIES: HD domain-containing phosphohydrolase [unclassified Acidovorax]OZA55685.1 MAG: phosphohydrolase [Acidovorax sp. 17-64-282]HQS21920.1 HD domain-containing phosphohydrolase [Acidovorax defluvii]OYY25983.1 MAG: phosphohydrolase [Acidovorax sp. 35-64-16]OYY83638.1 MAG: phosphohydrolase [Acidovorax sp. 28-64-14]OYZ42454.1 MAG: phosphohydrolase [Acidovorax sp. 16-64-162]
MTDPFLAATAPDSPHYLRALTDMADRRAVVTQDAIYTDNGIKLVEKGARIDSRLYDRLVQHKLREPIDRHLTVENAVDVSALIAAGQDLAEQGVLPQMLAQALGSAGKLLAPLRSVSLPDPVAFKLTVMRDQRPGLFEHSLQMMMVAVFLGLKSGLSERDCVPLAAAALLHDAGVLHMDPSWMDPLNKVTGVQRKHLVAHPITSMLMLKDAGVYPRSVEIAVLEHHERMDGSGYPRGLPGAEISPMGRILLLAEVVTAFYEKYTDMPAQRLSLVLRLNHRKFPAALVAHVLPLLHEDVARDSALMPLGADAPVQIDTLAGAFEQWEQLKAALPPAARQEPGSVFAFADIRLQALQKALIEAGSHPRQQGDLLEQLQGDALGLAEVALVGREALWQLQSIVNACYRRWPQLTDRASPADAAVADWCDWAMRKL